MASVTPYLIIDGASDAIDWYRDVFGAEELSRMTGGAGRIAHAEIRIGGSSIFIGDEHVHYENIHGPMRIGGTITACPDPRLLLEHVMDAKPTEFTSMSRETRVG